jgi:uncharacterized repeat protein (TIGR01451 family)
VGNLNDALDIEEEIVCPYQYTITESDFNTGSVTNLATATVGGVTSNQDGLTLTRVQSSGLTLAKAANPTSYAQVGQVINYTYTITNLGTTPLGPTQFVINDNKLTAPLNCGPADTILAPNQPINCAATYSITQADMGALNVTNSATASGAGQVSAAVSATVTNSALAPTPTPTLIITPPPSGSTCPTSQQQKVLGSTCLHQVAKGEWLIQIGRCYGVSLNELISANRSQIQDPSLILPSMLLTVPGLGSAGTIYGSPCIIFVTVQSGDTFPSLALRYNAREDVLRLANPGGLVVGQQARIPINSAGATSVTPIPGATATPTGTTAPIPAQRITIPAGQTSLPIAGVVNPLQSVSYVIAATPGQVLSVSLTGIPNTEATLGVTGPTGLALKPQDGNFNWNTTVTTGGDHTITVTSLIGGSSRTYTLTVGLTAPVAPTATPTNTPSTPIP